MIDHLILTPDRATVVELLAPLGFAFEHEDPETKETVSGFSGNVCLNIGGGNDESIRVVLADAQWDMTDPQNPVLVSPEQLVPGWYCIIACDTLNEALRDLPDNACRLITDRDAAANGQPFILYRAPDLTDETMAAVVRIEPTYLGSNYPFGAY